MKTGETREIEIQYPQCCLTCEEQIPQGTWAIWCKDVGLWHIECGRPRNLATYIKEAQGRTTGERL